MYMIRTRISVVFLDVWTSVMIINRYDVSDIILPKLLLASYIERNQICSCLTERKLNGTILVVGLVYSQYLT